MGIKKKNKPQRVVVSIRHTNCVEFHSCIGAWLDSLKDVRLYSVEITQDLDEDSSLAVIMRLDHDEVKRLNNVPFLLIEDSGKTISDYDTNWDGTNYTVWEVVK